MHLGDAPIVPEVVAGPPSLSASIIDMLNGQYSRMKSLTLVTAVSTIPLLGYGFFADRRWARWAGGAGIVTTLLLYNELTKVGKDRDRFIDVEIRKGV